MPLTREKPHSMGKDSEAGEKLRIRGKENGVTEEEVQREHRFRGKRTNQRRTCAWCRERRRVP